LYYLKEIRNDQDAKFNHVFKRLGVDVYASEEEVAKMQDMRTDIDLMKGNIEELKSKIDLILQKLG